MQDIADKLDVSRVTVSKVLNNNDGVSEDLKRRVIDTAIKMGYDKKQDALQMGEDDASPINIAIAVSRPDSSSFWLRIIHSIARELSGKNVNLIYSYLPSKANKKDLLPQNFYDGSIDGLIVLNVYNKIIYDKVQNVPLPKVILDSPADYCLADTRADIVYIAGRIATKKITRMLISKGFKKIGFIGDINYASTNRDRYDGFVDAMNEEGLAIRGEYCHTSEIGLGEYKRDIEDFITELILRDNLPDAFVCVSDFVAHFVIDFLKEKNYKVPEDIVVTGFDNNREYMERGSRFITTANVDLDAIGKKLVRQIMFRMDYPNDPYEVSYIASRVEFAD